MASIDQQFIEFIVKSLVGHPDDVQVERTIDEKGVLLELTVNPEDIGRVIGKRGSTAQSLRALLRALGTKNEARYNLKIIDVDRPEGERDQSQEHRDSVTDEKSTETENTSGLSTKDEVVQNSTDEVVEKSDTKDSDRLKKARAELADLDDLDI